MKNSRGRSRRRCVTVGATNGRTLQLTADQRATGIHLLGAPGTGKSKCAEYLIRQDIDAGHSVILIDPHESLYRAVLSYCARRRPTRPLYLCNVSTGDPVQPLGLLNPTDGDPTVLVDRCIEGTIKACGMINTDETPRLEKWLRAFYTVVMERGLSLADAELMLDYYARDARAYLSAGTTVEAEWRQLNEAKTPTQFDDAIGSAKNRLLRFTSARTVRRFLSVTDPTVTLDLMRFMDVGGILLVNIKPSPDLSPMNSRLFGTLLLTRIFDAARRRAVPHDGPHPHPCYLFIDEAQNFLTPDVAEILAQGRKMGLSLTLMHQTLEQVRAEDPRILAALHGAARTKIVFSLGSNADSTELVHEMFPGQINYNEVKRTDHETRFRPVATRETTYTVTRGTGESETIGKSHERGTSVNVAKTESNEFGTTETNGETVTRGSQSNDGVALAAGRSKGKSKTHTEATGSFSGTSFGDNAALSTVLTTGPDGGVTQSDGASASRLTGDSFGESDLTGDTEGTFESDNLSIAVAKQVGKNRSRSRVKTQGLNRSWGKSRGKTTGQSESDGESVTHGKNNNQSVTVGDAPGTKHLAYDHATHTLYGLDEQRQRTADEMRSLPQRTCIVRLPDATAHRVTVPVVKPVQLSSRRIAHYEDQVTRKAGALSAAAVDAAIDDSRKQIQSAAVVHLPSPTNSLLTSREHAGSHGSSRTNANRKPIRPNPQLNPANRKTKSSQGSNGSEG